MNTLEKEVQHLRKPRLVRDCYQKWQVTISYIMEPNFRTMLVTGPLNSTVWRYSKKDFSSEKQFFFVTHVRDRKANTCMKAGRRKGVKDWNVLNNCLKIKILSRSFAERHADTSMPTHLMLEGTYLQVDCRMRWRMALLKAFLHPSYPGPIPLPGDTQQTSKTPRKFSIVV